MYSPLFASRRFYCMLFLLSGMLVHLNYGMAQAAPGKPFLDWANLKNPVLQYPDWSIKDFACIHKDGIFYVLFSAFYEDRGQTRSHVVMVTTKDWKTYSEPALNIDGREDGWTGMCSPNVTLVGDTWYVTFNSWGKTHPNGGTNDLFYISSKDLKTWTPYKRIAEDLTKDKTCIDICILHENGKFYLFWIDDYLQGDKLKYKRVRLAVADNIDGPYRYVGAGYPNFLSDDTFENGQVHENYCVFKDNGAWKMITSDYGNKHRTVGLYELLGDGSQGWHFLNWGKGRALDLRHHDWNPADMANAAALYDWREHDGYYYLLYAGSTAADEKGCNYANRGWNKLGLARSRDLLHWEYPGPGDSK